MANIVAFTALRYNPDKVRLQSVLTQPYDKISPEMQAEYYAASPYNLVRLELGKPEAGDNEQENVYTRAAKFLQEAIEQRVLVRDNEPSIYAYTQIFSNPAGKDGEKLERRGFIALAKLAEYSEQVIYRNEQTLTKPKSDRLNLLR